MADDAGYPVLLKAAAGGGGRGMRLVEGPDALEPAFAMARAEAETAFGDGGLYLENAVAGAHHVELQVLGDGTAPGWSSASASARSSAATRSWCEEAPSPFLPDDTRQRMHEAGARAVEATRYRNAGTLEFLVSGDGDFYFMEMNTRLQVEHPVTEEVTGIDLVREQLRLAAGGELPARGVVALHGHALEFRLNAEDPTRGFLALARRA